MSSRAQGFWSYVHDDDDGDGGRVKRLASLIKAEYAALTGGDSLELFLDHAEIRWGDEWELRIEEALQATTFFIPVVTPRYFRSEECRKKLLGFAGHAKSLGLEELVLPLYYIEVPDLEDKEN
ncbi:MAG: toll/interleukin-1 receptor domain-containing protein, partial [Gaiellaceae bacterium MAG52_C11]|nr:toll/interleukin-1 receptor domain-containing protein [Candidatus Gaiellasilicea maunaloa]